jgi:DNA-binding winged helix-turn-helix (wHTH) protein
LKNGDGEVTTECGVFYYLIDNSIEFRPEESLLYSRKNGERVTLFVAASRCLQLLLNQQGKLVSQQELFDIGWNKSGIGVSSNTYYQNILMLRKGLKLAGCDQTVIRTVPRQGLTISLSVAVEKIAGEAPPLPAESEIVPEESMPDPSLTASKKKWRSQGSLWVTLSVLSCMGMLLYILWGHWVQEKLFSNYKYAGTIEQCSVYLYDRATSLNTYLQFIAHNKIDCTQQKYVYFTTHPLLPRASVIHCDHAYAPGVKNKCIPEYQLEWQAVE